MPSAATPLPPLLPGGVPALRHYPAFRRDRLGFWTEAGRHGPLVRVRFGSQEFWVVTDPAIAEHVLLGAVKDYPRDRRLMALNRGPGPELMFNTDRWEEWRWRRRLLQPAFHRAAVEGFSEKMVEQAERSADDWLRAGRIDLQAEMRTLTMRVILSAMFSVSRDDEVTRLQHSFETSSEVVAGRAAAPLPVPYWLPTPANVRLGRLLKYRWKTLAGIISERLETGPQSGDLLDLLIDEHITEDGKAFGLRDLVGEMSGIVFAGHETTAETLTWLMYLLAKHPRVGASVVAEIAEGPDANPPPGTSWLEASILETLRLYPPVYLTIREADRSHRAAGHPIPEGTRLVINIRGLHRDPNAWDDPDDFRPSRFFGSTDRHRYQFIPFLAGPKKCLGDHFAMLEMRLVAATLLGRLHMRYGSSVPPVAKAGFTLAVERGMPMEVRPRSLGRHARARSSR